MSGIYGYGWKEKIRIRKKELGSMYSDNMVLCAASAYEEKFYLDENFNALPDSIKDELKVMCVLYTQDIGGILVLEFDEDGNLQFRTEAAEGDFSYDEIGSVLKIKELQNTKRELLEALEMYYKVFFLGEVYED